MSEAADTANLAKIAHDEMPFRLTDMTLKFSFAELHPMLNTVGLKIDNIRKELKFQSKLALLEWDSRHWITLALGFVAFLFGSISGEIFDGGNAKLSGIDGLTGAISGFAYFQMLVSLILWVCYEISCNDIVTDVECYVPCTNYVPC